MRRERDREWRDMVVCCCRAKSEEKRRGAQNARNVNEGYARKCLNQTGVAVCNVGQPSAR